MTGIGFTAILFAIVFLALMVKGLSSGRDGSHAATRTTAPADNPPGTTSTRDPNTDGRTSAS